MTNQFWLDQLFMASLTFMIMLANFMLISKINALAFRLHERLNPLFLSIRKPPSQNITLTTCLTTWSEAHKIQFYLLRRKRRKTEPLEIKLFSALWQRAIKFFPPVPDVIYKNIFAKLIQ